MRSYLQTTLVLAAITRLSFANDPQDDHEDNPCKSYGIDFQDRGAYFQNISSKDPFTFVSIFEGCQPDYANNILVDPYGDQHMCSDTPLTPDDKPQMSTCDLQKNELWTGPWSVIIISNNGEAEPIAYMRDFNLTVAEPATTIYTPTATITAIITPIVNRTITSWETDISTSTKVVTSPAFTKTKTITTTPKRVTTTRTKTLGTITKTKFKVEPTVITKTKTKTCSVPRRQPTRDPWCTFTPTLVHAAALETSPAPTASPSSKSGSHRRQDAVHKLPLDIEQRLAERRARLAEAPVLEKRGLDNATATITETDTSKFSTSTVSVTTTTSTLISSTVLTTKTTVVSTSTTYKGVTRPVVTKTAPTPTKTKTKYTVIRTTATITRRPKITITTKWAPASSTAICKAKGGKLV